MPRHLTLADIGRGASRHRRPRSRWAVPAVTAAVSLLVAGGAVALPRIGASSGSNAPSAAAGRCSRGTTPLVVAASVDKSAMLTRFAQQFSATGSDAAGRCVEVTVVPRSSGAAEALLAGGWPEDPKPDVWSPSAALWLPLLEARLAGSQRSSLVPDVAAVPRIAASPLVVAMPRPMAVAMGWPTAAIGWADLLRLASARRQSDRNEAVLSP